MANGTIQSSTGTNLEIGVEWSSAANTAANASAVTAKVYLLHYQIYCAALTGSCVTVGDSTEYFTAAVSSSSGGLQKTYIAEKTFTVPHGADGSKSVKIFAGYVFNGTYNGHYIGTLSVSGTASLDKIPRASGFTAPSVLTLTKQTTVKVTPALSSYTHCAVMKIGSKSYRTPVVSGTSLTFTPPAALADGAPNSKKPSGTLTVETYGGGVKIGEVTKNCTYAVPDTAEFQPDFTFSVTPQNSSPLLDSEGVLAASLSSLTVSVSSKTARHGAAVASVKVSCGGKSVSGDSLSAGPLSAGSYVCSATVTDSRGISRTKSESVSVLPYHPPYAEAVSVTRCLEDGTPDDAGTYLSAYAKSVCSPIGGINTASLTLVLKSRSGATLGTWSLASEERKTVAASLSPLNSYTVSVTATDTAGRSGEYRLTVPTSKVDVHLKDGRLRLGGYAERAGLEVDWDARFNSDVFIGDEPVADFVTECGTTGIWTWRKYASGASECFGTTEEKTYSLASSYGTLRSSPSSAVNSEQYPRGLFSAAPSVTVTSARGSHAVLLAPRDAGSAGASPNYFVLYPSVPGIDSVSTAIHIAARGKYK